MKLDKLPVSVEIADELRYEDEVSFPEGDEMLTLTYVNGSERIINKARWYLLTERVFEVGSIYYRLTYMDPSTESQEGQDMFFTNSDGMVELDEVFKVEVIENKFMNAKEREKHQEE